MAHATLLKNGLIVDGSGQPGWTGDLLLAGDRIVALSAPGQTRSALPAGAESLTEVDCSGCVIAPGFIDVHLSLIHI